MAQVLLVPLLILINNYYCCYCERINPILSDNYIILNSFPHFNTIRYFLLSIIDLDLDINFNLSNTTLHFTHNFLINIILILLWELDFLLEGELQ